MVVKSGFCCLGGKGWQKEKVGGAGVQVREEAGKERKAGGRAPSGLFPTPSLLRTPRPLPSRRPGTARPAGDGDAHGARTLGRPCPALSLRLRERLLRVLADDTQNTFSGLVTVLTAVLEDTCPYLDWEK